MLLLYGILLLNEGELLAVEQFPFTGRSAVDGALLRSHLAAQAVDVGCNGLRYLLVCGVAVYLPRRGLLQIGLKQTVDVKVGLPYPTTDFLRRGIRNGRTGLVIVIRAVGGGAGEEQEESDKRIDDFRHSFF